MSKISDLFERLLKKLPFNGYKAALGYALTKAAPFVPDPTLSMILLAIGEVLLPVGLAHKVAKELKK